MPASATQADYGAEIYRLVCQDCHGDQGQGLTAEWIATAFAPEDQNCWQAKCHSGSHPVDGFILPEYVPPLAGEEALLRFETSLDLYNFMRVTMPYHNPGSLLEKEYWQLTAFIIRLNDLDPMTTPLDETRAASIRLHSERVTSSPTALPESAAAIQPALTGAETSWWRLMLVLVATSLGAGVLYWRRQP